MNEPFYEGQEVRWFISPKHGGAIYGMLACPKPAWPGMAMIVNDKYPWGTYCGFKWIKSINNEPAKPSLCGYPVIESLTGRRHWSEEE